MVADRSRSVPRGSLAAEKSTEDTKVHKRPEVQALISVTSSVDPRVISQFGLFVGVILSEAVVQAERRACPERLTGGKELNGIPRGAPILHARSLVPLVKARDFGMTPASRSKVRHNYCASSVVAGLPQML